MTVSLKQSSDTHAPINIAQCGFDCGFQFADEKEQGFRLVKEESTFQKWKCELDRECKTVTWLDCETVVEGGAKVENKLKCTVCEKFRSQILCKRNFSDRWIAGADSVCTSNIRDHASSEQHHHAMALLQRELQTGKSLTSTASIVVALTSLSEDEKVKG